MKAATKLNNVNRRPAVAAWSSFREVNMKKKLLIMTAVFATLSVGTALAVNNPQPIDADEKTPLVAQVENHEERIDDLEVKTDATQTQVNQNTADIGAVQTQTGINPAPPVAPVQTPVAQLPPASPNPPPTPEPTIDPWTIISMTDTPTAHGHKCSYVMQNGTTKNVNTGEGTTCMAVGTALPQWLR